jgi:hypothetical protein
MEGRLPFEARHGSFVNILADPQGSETDSDGRYEILGTGPGAGMLYVTHADFAPAWIPVELSGEGSATRDVVLTPGGALELRAPKAWELISAHPELRLTAPGLPLPVVLPLADLGAGMHAFAAGPGVAVFPHLPPATWTAEVAWGAGTRREVAVVREGEKTVVGFAEGGTP